MQSTHGYFNFQFGFGSSNSFKRQLLWYKLFLRNSCSSPPNNDIISNFYETLNLQLSPLIKCGNAFFSASIHLSKKFSRSLHSTVSSSETVSLRTIIEIDGRGGVAGTIPAVQLFFHGLQLLIVPISSARSANILLRKLINQFHCNFLYNMMA